MPHLRRLLHLAAAAIAVMMGALAADAASPVIHKVGAVTRHAARYLNQDVMLRGYLLARGNGYVLFSDEPGGKISRYDLPVIGPGVDQMKPMQRYIVEGTFLDHGLAASNGSPVHLELTAPPSAVP